MEVYEKQFLESIFEEFKSNVTKKDFINAIEEMDFKEKLQAKKEILRTKTKKGLKI